MSSPAASIADLGQSIWCDSISRNMIESGDLKRLIDLGVTGLTSNPTIFEKAIGQSDDYDKSIYELANLGKSVDEIYEALVVEDIKAAADLLRPVYDVTEGADGYVSLEVNPHFAHDTENTIREARRLFLTLDRPNVMMKVPATNEGMPAISQLISENINVNVTLIFSLEAYSFVRQSYLSGLEGLVKSGGNPATVSSVASFFVSRLDTAVDTLLKDLGGDELKHLEGRAAVANAKLAYMDFGKDFYSGKFQLLKEKGSKVQRPLWASTSTKNPEYNDLLYVESLIGRDTVNTMPVETLATFIDHGVVEETLVKSVDESEQLINSLSEVGISIDEVTSQLLNQGVQSFSDSFDKLMSNLDSKIYQILN